PEAVPLSPAALLDADHPGAGTFPTRDVPSRVRSHGGGTRQSPRRAHAAESSPTSSTEISASRPNNPNFGWRGSSGRASESPAPSPYARGHSNRKGRRRRDPPISYERAALRPGRVRGAFCATYELSGRAPTIALWGRANNSRLASISNLNCIIEVAGDT